MTVPSLPPVLAPEDAVRHAVANARLSGLELSPTWVGLLRQVAYGRLTIEQALQVAKRVDTE
jgi:hypothetical protein